MDKCPKCGVPAMQVENGECIECRLFQVHRDPEPVTFAEKLKVLVSRPGTDTFFTLMAPLWAGRIAVRFLPVPTGKCVKYLYFERGSLVTMAVHFKSNAMDNSKLSMMDLESDQWHLLPEDMEFSSPVEDREARAIRVLNHFSTDDRKRFFAHCEHAETWMDQ